MKKILLAVALMTGAVSAHAKNLAFPVYGCTLNADISNTASRVELIVIRAETVFGKGMVSCMDAVGQTYAQKVNVVIQSGGIGPAVNGDLQGLKVFAVRAGLVTTDGMAGEYNLSVGPRLGLINARAGVMVGAQISGQGVGLGIEAVIENRFSIGLDLGGMVMTVTPTSELRRVRK